MSGLKRCLAVARAFYLQLIAFEAVAIAVQVPWEDFLLVEAEDFESTLNSDGGIDRNGVINPIDVQLVINVALGV